MSDANHLIEGLIAESSAVQAFSPLSILDWVVIVLYFVFVLAIGLYYRHQSETSAEYFLAGRRNSSWIAGIAFLSANMGALELLGFAGMASKYGILAAHWYWIGAIPAMLFLGLFMMPFYYASRIHSVPAYLQYRFNGATRTVSALGFAVMTLLVSGINVYAMALIFNIFLGWDMHVSILVSSLTVAAYIGLSGLISAIFSEVLQFFLIWFGLVLVVILGWVDVGGWEQISGNVDNTLMHLWATTGDINANALYVNWFAIAMGLGFVLSFGYWTTDFLVVQRAFTGRDLRSAQLAPVLASFFKMIMPVIVILPGLIYLALNNTGQIADIAEYDHTLLVLIEQYYPPGLLGLGVTALLAGFMAGQAGNISAFNTVFTYDLYKPYIKPNAHDHHYVTVGRIATIVGVLISIMTAYWAMSMSTIMEYMQALFSIIFAPLLTVILLGMFWKRATSSGAFWGLLIGTIISAVMFLSLHFGLIPIEHFIVGVSSADVQLHGASSYEMAANLWRAVWAFFLTVFITVVLSLLTKPPREEDLTNLVYGSMVINNYRGFAWYKRPGVWAWISLIAFVVINVIFW